MNNIKTASAEMYQNRIGEIVCALSQTTTKGLQRFRASFTMLQEREGDSHIGFSSSLKVLLRNSNPKLRDPGRSRRAEEEEFGRGLEKEYDKQKSQRRIELLLLEKTKKTLALSGWEGSGAAREERKRNQSIVSLGL